MTNPQQKPTRVITVAPMPSEKCAYALARYSRSPDSIRQSIEWVRTHNSQSFLESFYFQYGHASIADLGHVATASPLSAKVGFESFLSRQTFAKQSMTA